MAAHRPVVVVTDCSPHIGPRMSAHTLPVIDRSLGYTAHTAVHIADTRSLAADRTSARIVVAVHIHRIVGIAGHPAGKSRRRAGGYWLPGGSWTAGYSGSCPESAAKGSPPGRRGRPPMIRVLTL